MTDITIIKISGKPIEKLIETVSSVIGTLYKPRAMRNEADAEAYKIIKLEEAKAKGLILKSDAEIEILSRAKERFINHELNRQLNIETIAEKAEKYLNETVSEQPVDIDWRTKFFNKSKDISTDKMQEIWANILAEEVNEPGKTSLRTLDIISNLCKKEAELFQIAASISFFKSGILKTNSQNSFDDYGLSFSNVLILKSAGLIYESDSLNVTYPFQEQFNGVIISFGEIFIIVRKDGLTNFTFDQIKFTPAGEELNKILKIESNYSYLDKFIEQKTKENYKFEKLNLKQITVKLNETHNKNQKTE